MVIGASLQLFHHFGCVQKFGHSNQFKVRFEEPVPFAQHSPFFLYIDLTKESIVEGYYEEMTCDDISCEMLPSVRQDAWSREFSTKIYKPLYVPYRQNTFRCRSSSPPSVGQGVPLLRDATLILNRSCNNLLGSDFTMQLVPAFGVIAFGIWGLVPLMRYLRSLLHNDNNWKKSKIYYISTSYLQPLLLWIGATLICGVLDPINLPIAASQAVKQRVLTFVRSLSAVLAFACCLSNLIQQTQKFFVETSSADDTRKMGFQFAGKAIYTAVWVAAVSLFMELLGFSTQKWLTAGGLGTVLLTLAGREIFTNFLSSVMIHATRPFILNEWIQTKIEGYEVSGTVEHVGWWSPTIIRGDDREAVHIPNHKFTVTVVRNLTQRTHWRIKTHLAISHLDANKISNIVADMRKVLAKNPQIEQQRLHRRVFLENVDPENQALMILVSCFVKTTHFEEYLCVKEAVLLDLLRVISHHKARLATPIRTVQKVYGDPEIVNIPFAENIYNRADPSVRRPFLLIEPPTRINGDDKAKPRSSPRASEDQIGKAGAATEVTGTLSSESTILNNSDKQQQKNTSSGDSQPESSKSSTSPSTLEVEHLETSDASSKGSGQKPSVPEAVTQSNYSVVPSTNAKNEAERVSAVTASSGRSAFEDNIVLGVALEGSKRTLPIEEGMGPSTSQLDTNELTSGRAGSTSSTSTEKRGPALSVDQRDQER